jgi:type IV fimbrial biogenesis protein FimT
MTPTLHKAAQSRSRCIPCVRAQAGTTLVETLAVVLITLLLVLSALPQLQQWRNRQMLSATAATLETQVRYARSMAQAMDSPVRLSVLALPAGAGTGNCTVVHTGAANACSCDGHGHAQCSANSKLLQMSEHIAQRDGASVTNVGRSLLFAPGKGTVTPTATLTVTSRDGRSMNKIVNIVGRVRSCSNSHLTGVPACA